jgi:hypothetical protein
MSLDGAKLKVTLQTDMGLGGNHAIATNCFH